MYLFSPPVQFYLSVRPLAICWSPIVMKLAVCWPPIVMKLATVGNLLL